MPRTKRRTVKRPSADLSTTGNMTMANQSKTMKDILDEYENAKKDIEPYFSDVYDDCRNMIENSFLMVKMNFSGMLDIKLIDSIAENNSVKTTGVSASKQVEKPTKPVTKTTGLRSSRQKVADVSSKQANSSNKDRAPLLEKNESKFKTPSNRPPVPSAATVTPKVNMNEPMSVMRRPNQGEVALSMTGSPLMVSSVSRDDMATVSVPLANGNILSILPRAGSAMNISFDEQTKKELLLLKGNIEGLLKMNSDF